MTPKRSALPRLPSGLLVRPHLEQRLDERAPMTVIQGLGGSGKSALVAEWLERQQAGELSWVWVTATRDRTGRGFERS